MKSIVEILKVGLVVGLLTTGLRTAQTYPLVTTGQTNCYNNTAQIAPRKPGLAFYGQDAQFPSMQFRFHDNGDGTVTDQATGLMWWQADSGKGMDWQHALAWAQTMNAANYLSHSDWRLPNVKELQSLVDYSRSPTATKPANVGPAINRLFHCTSITNEAGHADYPYYWTSTSARFQTGTPSYYAWYVAFGMAVNHEGEDFHGAGAVRFHSKVKGGPAGEGGERYFNYVRLVRTVATR